MSSSLENKLISKGILKIGKDLAVDNREALYPGAGRISKEETMVATVNTALQTFPSLVSSLLRTRPGWSG
jgi:hypothetical protein